MTPADALEIPLPPSPPITPASIPLPDTPQKQKQKPRLTSGLGGSYVDLPPRRPAGWRPSISSAPRNISASSVVEGPRRTWSSALGHPQANPQAKDRVASASVVSVGGRVVSGTMQYALMPLSLGGDSLLNDESAGWNGPALELPSPPPTAALAVEGGEGGHSNEVNKENEEDEDVSVSGSVLELDLAAYDQALVSAHAEDPPWTPDGLSDRGYQASLDGEIELELDDEEDGDDDDRESQDDNANMYPDAYATNQDQDEIWMSYVRQQLNTLFPDFFADTAAMTATATAAGHGGMPTPPLSSRQPSGATQDAVSAEGEDRDEGGEGNASFDTSVSSVGPPTPADTRHTVRPYGMPVGNVRVPNVRDEISDLREEIGRLRGVVGGLAEGLARGAAQETNPLPHQPPPVTTTASHVEEDAPSFHDKIPKAFFGNASKIADVIRLLDRAAVKNTDERTRDACDAQKDEAVFDLDNLSRLEAWVRSTSA